MTSQMVIFSQARSVNGQGCILSRENFAMNVDLLFDGREVFGLSFGSLRHS